MYGTFSGCKSLKTYVGSTDADGDFSNYVIPSNVTELKRTFEQCTSFTIAPAIPLNVTSMESTFDGCTSLTTAPVIPSKVIYVFRTFCDCTSLTGTITINISTTNINSSSYLACFGGVDMTNITLTGEASTTLLNNIGRTGNNWTPIP